MNTLRIVPLVGTFLASILPLAGALHGQLPPASPATAGTAGSSMAGARGAAALGINPAALALPSGPGWSLVLPSGSLLTGLDPVTGGDLGRSGEAVSREERLEWLELISSAGMQRGQVGAELTAVAFSTGPVGIQVSTVAMGLTRLEPDAAELLLFGNAGLTGAAGDFELAGSSLDLGVYTTAAAALALPLDLRLGKWEDQALGVAATLKYTEGNLLMLGRDGGSVLRGTPVEVDLRFPVIQSDSTLEPGRNGGGVGLDVGMAWEGGPWSAGVLLENVFHTFRWDHTALFYRPGEALFDAGDTTSDFDPRPLADGPAGLRALVEELRFRPRLGVGIAHGRGSSTLLTASLRQQFGEGIVLGPRREVAVGIEHAPSPSLPLRAGVAMVTDGWRGAVGGGLRLGLVELQAAGMLQRGDSGSATLLTFGIQVAGR